MYKIILALLIAGIFLGGAIWWGKKCNIFQGNSIAYYLTCAFRTNQPVRPSADGLIDFSIVILQFNEGTDVKAFAKKYNIPFEKIDGPSSAGTYIVPVPEGKSALSAVEIFGKDPDVKSAKPVIHSYAF